MLTNRHGLREEGILPLHNGGRVRAFTLIELLIVIAIMAVLAAIAIPNLLEAQTRAKVASAKSGLRTLVLGIEAYTTDHNVPPYAEHVGQTVWMPAGGRPRVNLTGAMCGGITSPVAYLSQLPEDPFKHPIDGVPQVAPLYYDRAGFGFVDGVYQPNMYVHVPRDAVGTSRLDGTGPDVIVSRSALLPQQYVVYSLGPDLLFTSPGSPVEIKSRFNLNNRYDPTNGTVSRGNVVRFPSGADFP